ncbi:type IV pilus assembly protein PilQ [Maribacter sedimenticola]|uniref:Type IV pilus assembly protein PilQ n=1 Tax=Maribacter sedimenticola TaxID=228956 RepID=A0ABY1SJ74_9FLAO|nr:general secretion pathway protein GspD [Maribacter sedimenticola]SNR62984.1 type IV pilus assembly protein PilQ [Maribacter sedimenticola]
MKNLLTILMLIASIQLCAQKSDRIERIKNQLELLAIDNSELNENLKLEFNVNNVTLPNFLLAISKVHNLNMSISPDIQNLTIVNNFSNVTVSDLLVYLCKEYYLDIEFTGNILSIKKYLEPIEPPIEKVIQVAYNANDLISLDLKKDPLGKVFRKIMDLSGKNLLFSNGLETKPLNIYLSNVPFEMAMEKLAATNGLAFSKTKDGFYLFDAIDEISTNAINSNQRLIFNNLGYQVIDTLRQKLDVDLKNTSIAALIKGLKQDLKLNIYTASPLSEAGNVTFNAKNITFDELLDHVFTGKVSQANTQLVSGNSLSNRNSRQTEVQPQQDNSKNFTFKKQDNIYFLGTADQLSLRKVEVIQLMHRSVELLGNPSQVKGSRSSGRTNEGSVNYFGTNGNTNYQQNTLGNQRNINTQSSSNFGQYQDGAEAIVSIIPDEIKSDLDIKVDYELNSFLVSGPASNINRFKKFLKEIDKPVPVVLIEVMIIEVKKSASVETGISWGIGEAPVNTQGKLFPSTDITLGANTVNKIIGGFDGFGSFNMGKVIPDFFANIKAMEANGNLKIRSSPKLSTLNGHRANLSIGETTYYVVTNQNFFGSQIPTTSEVRNYLPIDAELAIGIKPLVSGDGQVTLDINVIQSDFNGERIEDDAPPGLTSREFSSIIRMQNQDLAILGGLEEKVKNDSGNGVPLLSRIPVIKWLFSQRKREDVKQKLTILIKPTVIY